MFDRFRKEALKTQEELNTPRNWEELTDKEYKNEWEAYNIDVKYFLTCLNKWLSKYEGLNTTEWGFKTTNYMILLYQVNEALKIGLKTGYYWNKESKKIISADLSYFAINKGV